MNPILSTGLLIGVLCGLWTFVMGFTGWYKDPGMTYVFICVVTAIEIGGLIWGLRKTAAQGRNYRAQILAGTMMAIVAGVIIVAATLLFTTLVFPAWFTDLEQVYRTTLRQQGKSDADIAAAIQANAASMTPMAQAMSGFIGTLVTGIVASAVIAIFVRAKPPTAMGARTTMSR
jgi:uncharacterized protein DUF4199